MIDNDGHLMIAIYHDILSKYRANASGKPSYYCKPKAGERYLLFKNVYAIRHIRIHMKYFLHISIVLQNKLHT